MPTESPLKKQKYSIVAGDRVMVAVLASELREHFNELRKRWTPKKGFMYVNLTKHHNKSRWLCRKCLEALFYDSPKINEYVENIPTRTDPLTCYKCHTALEYRLTREGAQKAIQWAYDIVKRGDTLPDSVWYYFIIGTTTLLTGDPQWDQAAYAFYISQDRGETLGKE